MNKESGDLCIEQQKGMDCKVNIDRQMQWEYDVKFAMMGKFDRWQSEKNLRRGVVHRENRVYIEVVYKSEGGEIRLLIRAPKNVMVIEWEVRWIKIMHGVE